MPFWTTQERRFAQAVSDFVFFNPFQKEGSQARFTAALKQARQLQKSPNGKGPAGTDESAALLVCATELLNGTAQREFSSADVGDELFRLYQDLVLYAMYYSFRDRFQETIDESHSAQRSRNSAIDYYPQFKARWESYWSHPGLSRGPSYTCPHAFACLFQIRRAYYHINEFLWGDSAPIDRLRAEIWQSIFSHDFRRFGLLLYDRMETITTLVAGPSGTGKELTARAIGLSRHIPFHEKSGKFTELAGDAFHPVNIAALSPTVVESELFGHVKGSFTGAVTDRQGYFEQCQRGHAVFLDEIGELSPAVQVKLLRVVQNREFHRLGETKARPFSGKLIVATNRDFQKELAAGRFREDLYYRLCSDVITTPSLQQQIAGEQQRLRELAARIAHRQLGDWESARLIADDAMQVIENDLGADYDWPGNFRELEQCVWNVLIRKSYRPLSQRRSQPEHPTIAAIRSGTATAQEIIASYCRAVYARTGSFAGTARIVGLDQRTVKKHVSGDGRS